MLAMLLSVLIAQYVVSPVQPPAAAWAPPGWTSATFATPLEYGHFVRHEADGTDSVLSTSRQVCDCQPVTMMTMLQRALTAISKGTAVEQRSSTTACGHPAEYLLVTNLANATNVLRNNETIAFRDGDALVVLNYTFRSDRPMPDAAATLATLCPPLPSAQPSATP